MRCSDKLVSPQEDRAALPVPLGGSGALQLSTRGGGGGGGGRGGGGGGEQGVQGPPFANEQY